MLKSEYLDEIEKINTHCALPYQIDKTFYQIKNWAEQYEIEHHESVLWDLLRTFFFDWNNHSAMNEVAQDALDEDGWRGALDLLVKVDAARSVFKLNDAGYFENVTRRDLDSFKAEILKIIQNQMKPDELEDRLRKQQMKEFENGNE